MSFNEKKKVVVAMSGGVDSNVTSHLLIKQGYEVIGLTAIMFDAGERIAQNAARTCQTVGIKHEVLDLREDFKNTVINYFEESYKLGLTPNPCVFCNRKIKWGKMKEFVFNRLGADFYATGHYARIAEYEGTYRLYRASDPAKDQSYMLYALTQEDLAGTLFPLGGQPKSTTREIAGENDITPVDNRESQDVCFIHPPETTSSYLTKRFKEQQGDIVEFKTGKILGTHTGVYNYTIGQRKGIRVSASGPLYVISLDPAQNRIYVGSKEHLSSSCFEVSGVNWQQPEFAGKESFPAMVKIRYNSPARRASIINLDNNKVRVEFEQPKSAITPGQAAVFYDENNEYLLAGGTIGKHPALSIMPAQV